MGAFDNIFSGIGGGMNNWAMVAVWALIAIGILTMCGFSLYYFLYKKKTWNISTEIKIPRSDGKLLTAEWGKGNYDLNKGVVWIKRKGKKPVAMKPFDTERYLQGNMKGQNILTTVQISPGHYVPVLLESFLEMEDDTTGEIAALAKVKADYSESKSWKNQFEREAKNAYTIFNLLKEYAPYIGTGLMIFMMWAGFAILYSKVA